MKLIPYHTGRYGRFFLYRWIDRYQNPHWFVLLWVPTHTRLFRPYWRKLDVSAGKSKLGRYQKKKKIQNTKKPKNHLFLSSQPLTTTSPVTPMSPTTSILSIAVSPLASASSSLPLHFSVLCFSSTFQLLCSLVFLVLNAWYILFWTLESHSHVNILKSLNESKFFKIFKLISKYPRVLVLTFAHVYREKKKKKSFAHWFFFHFFFFINAFSKHMYLVLLLNYNSS